MQANGFVFFGPICLDLFQEMIGAWDHKESSRRTAPSSRALAGKELDLFAPAFFSYAADQKRAGTRPGYLRP
jgi:hypothetical protein